MKIRLVALTIIVLNLVIANAFAIECASWMDCNHQGSSNENSQYSAGQWNANSFARSADSHEYSNSLWRDEYATADPRLMPKDIKPTGRNLFVFSPKMRQWGAYNGSGELIAFGRANGGDSYCPDVGGFCHTPKGLYSVYRKGSASCISHTFPIGKGGAKMPYCMFFHNGYSIHGSPYLSLHNGSHGCIRVTVQAAQWLSANFISTGTKVLVLPY